MTRRLQPITTRQFLVTLEGVSAYFQTCTAPNETLRPEEYNDGLTGQTLRHYDFSQFDPVTLTKPHDPREDVALLEWANARLKDRQRFTCTIQPVNPDQAGTPLEGAKTVTLTEACLIRRQLPAVDRAGSGMAMLELELDFRGIALN